ncbi:hypothetical protein BCR33DRAFT_785981 [Rhizoclosmatium globosum]|uniref:ABC transmembrane type-1 domain-containing protein n=1 Tax=Rhizoclosmatium globosum TaxID=329046 RepID=A0A1Y2C8C0_9FUNG|nr:hypothetical protein BCR33DRAFT_785981 [Rhizoclosmatium globosum]|eukprot:ORY43124.1 hypothetical protein BCR33DRAFT_785981 [Rhizoclosmatium globosum]
MTDYDQVFRQKEGSYSAVQSSESERNGVEDGQEEEEDEEDEAEECEQDERGSVTVAAIATLGLATALVRAVFFDESFGFEPFHSVLAVAVASKVFDVVSKAVMVYLARPSGIIRGNLSKTSPFLFLARVVAAASVFDLAVNWKTPLFPALSLVFYSLLALCAPSWAEYPSKVWPELVASLWSRVSFSWMNSLINLASTRSLTFDDLWHLDYNDKGATVYARFGERVQTGYEKGTLLRIILNLNFGILTYEFTLSLVDHLFIFGGPFFINRILRAIADSNTQSEDIMYPVIGLLLSSFARTILESQLYWVNRKIDVRIRAALFGAIFKKGLCRMQPPTPLSTNANSNNVSFSDGAISNLMTADTDKILACFRQSHYLVSVPFLLILCSTLLIQTIGIPGTIAGLLSLSLAVPATKKIGAQIKKFRKQLMNHSDSRLSHFAQILSGIRTIKLYTWEPHFLATNLRKPNSNMLTQIVWRCCPILAAGVTFLVMAIVNGPSRPVDAAAAFTVLAMYNNVLKYPLFIVPKLAISVMELKVSLGRIEEFLLEPDLERVVETQLALGSNSEQLYDEMNELKLGFTGNAAF